MNAVAAESESARGIDWIHTQNALAPEKPSFVYFRHRLSSVAVRDRTLAAADLLRKVGHGDSPEMGALLAQAIPRIPPHPVASADPY